MRLNINTNIQHLREDEIISILNESDNKYPESARVADDISAYPAHSNTTGSNRLTSLTDFLAMMSHNLRTSLNGVLGESGSMILEVNTFKLRDCVEKALDSFSRRTMIKSLDMFPEKSLVLTYLNL